MLWLHLATAGLWPIFETWGLGICLVAGLLALAWFSPIWKVDFLWLAALAAGVLAAMGYQARLDKARFAAQQIVITTTVDKTVNGTNTASSKAEKDPYDSLQN